MFRYRFIFLLVLLLNMGIIFADPTVPPPPPSITSYTYSLMDEFKGCGPEDGVANFCDEYYARVKVVAKAGSITENTLTYVCGKDPRCSEGQACQVPSVNDNNKWQSVPLDDNWVCPDGYGVAHIHSPGNLDPNFDDLSFSFQSLMSNSLALRSNDQIDIFFPAYIPACVNRIPMMNFNVYLEDNFNNRYSEKTGLYAKHETLSYDANVFGGVLENFRIPDHREFRMTYDLKANLNSYRMWSFRERFVEGLQRTIEDKDLQLPININVDSLNGNQANDFESIYFSRDFMLGAFRVDNQNNAPVGENLIQEVGVICNFDVNDLNINSIDNDEDLRDALQSSSSKNQIINRLENDISICNFDSSMVLKDVIYREGLEGYDYESDMKRVNFDIGDISPSSYDNAKDFYENWAPSNLATLGARLQDLNKLDDYNPEEIISSLGSITYDREVKNIRVDTRDLGFSDSDDFINYIVSLNQNDYASFSNELIDGNFIDDLNLIDEIISYSKQNSNEVNLRLELVTENVRLDVNIDQIFPYNALVSVDLILEYETNTDASWNWRSLESLTLNQLGRCLYNWDECLFDPKNQNGINWQMNEVADLGYGPIFNSVAYIWSQQTLESEYEDLNFGYHFDGARGEDSLEFAITSYRECNENQTWISQEGYYSCYDGEVYKCGYGLSADELELGYVRSANIGNTILVSNGAGFACVQDSGNYVWKEINCLGDQSVLS
jgi:hypothetical protein